MKNSSLRSECPINYSLQTVGDAWSLLIIRDIIYFGKKTFGEFLASDEGIARNILTNRLNQLVGSDILRRMPHPTDRRKEIYQLTEKGLDLVPILLDLAEWGGVHYRNANMPEDWLRLTRDERHRMIKLIKKTARVGGAVFADVTNIIKQHDPGAGHSQDAQ